MKDSVYTLTRSTAEADILDGIFATRDDAIKYATGKYTDWLPIGVPLVFRPYEDCFVADLGSDELVITEVRVQGGE